ncbi:fibrinogen-like protein 1 [Mizuhopecten yessoensis]|uniref:Techylectin-5B n=1 Tax=Mizuhopecten yessoensis TaxID=6573 RepID=A0A210PMS2_MIZYE|nr:fibrinogen-like protein 1 [Mizuhopecten yessoensis]OWF37763.1 Techylectin-5B [Mizuhopecten yessoensis]
MVNIRSLLLLLAISLLYLDTSNCQTHLYQELDNHDIRLTALEQMMLNLTQACNHMQQNYEDVKQENAVLKAVAMTLTVRVEALEQNGTGQAAQTNIGGTSPSQTVTATSSQTSQATYVSTSPQTHGPPTSSTTPPKVIPRDCAHAQRMGSRQSGVYRIQPQDDNRTFEVHCDMVDDGGGWTTIQRRMDGTENFERNWNDYKNGFGNISRNFWIGNDLLYGLTSRGHMTFHVNLDDWEGVRRWAEYQDFQVGSELSWYMLSVGKYTGTAGDSFHYPASSLLRHDGMKFSTPDHDNDTSFQQCGRMLKSGWWFNSCYSSNLNGPYLTQPSGKHTYGESWGQPSMDGTGIEWYPWKKHQYSFKYSEMKIRPTNFV